MPDSGRFVYPILEDTIDQCLLDIADKEYKNFELDPDKDWQEILRRVRKEVRPRRARIDDFDAMTKFDYTYNFAATGEQATSGQCFFLATNTKKPLAMLFSGWALGTLDGNLDYLRVEINSTTVREWPGVVVEENGEGEWMCDDPVYALGDEQMRIYPAIIAIDAACRTFPTVYLFFRKGNQG